MNLSPAPKELDQKSISSRINANENGVIEYTKMGHGLIKTNRPLTSVLLELALDDSGLTQAQVAQLAGTEQPTISRIIDGKTKQSRHIAKIAKVLGVSSEWLAGLDEGTETVKVTDNVLRISDEVFILVSMYEGAHNSHAKGHKNSARDSKTMIAARLIEKSINHSDLRFIIEDDRANVPDIRLGASVIFNTNNTEINNGDFFVIQHGSLKPCVRKLYLEPNGDIRIRANQDDFPEYIVSKDDPSFNILGKVVFVTNVY